VIERRASGKWKLYAVQAVAWILITVFGVVGHEDSALGLSFHVFMALASVGLAIALYRTRFKEPPAYGGAETRGQWLARQERKTPSRGDRG
jgi:O-antigen/teichoic acid export membrane protein